MVMLLVYNMPSMKAIDNVVVIGSRINWTNLQSYSTHSVILMVFPMVQMYILDEMFSPLVTPFILYLSLRRRAPQVVDFLRNFTIDVSGVGDVCSFAEMNVKKHGNSEVCMIQIHYSAWLCSTILGKIYIQLHGGSQATYV